MSDPGGMFGRRSAAGGAARHLSLAMVAVLLGLILCCAGCRTTIVPPRDPPQPTLVYLIDYGRTSAVALPAGSAEGDTGEDESAGLMRYVYGEWDWYAMQRTGAWQAITALAWPTTGALGRGELAAPPPGAPEALRRSLGAQQVYELTVAGERAKRLRRELDALHAELAADGPRASSYGAEFVQHPRKYTMWCNSNHQSALWLEQLGCETRGWAVLSRWRVALPAHPPTQPADEGAASARR